MREEETPAPVVRDAISLLYELTIHSKKGYTNLIIRNPESNEELILSGLKI